MYNQQKKTIEELKEFKSDGENEKRKLIEKIELLEKANSKLKADLNKEAEHRNDALKAQAREMESLERKLAEKEKDVQGWEEERHEWSLAEKDFKEQLKQKEKKIIELEHDVELKKAKASQDISLLTQQKDQLSQEVKTLQKKLDIEEKENENWTQEERKLRKQVTQLTFANEELNEKIAHLQKKINKVEASSEEEASSRDNVPLDRLAEIERKIETIATLQKTGSKSKLRDAQPEAEPEELKEESENNTEKQAEQEEGQNQEEQNENAQDQEIMLKQLTSQILQKEELKNDHISKFFKLEKIQLEDKANEYKNLLKSMGALYFANHYGNIAATIFNHWKEVYQDPPAYEGNEEEQVPQQVEAGSTDKGSNDYQIRGNTESDPGPIKEMEPADNDVEELLQEKDSGSLNKHGIEIDTELANQEAIGKMEMNEELMNQIQINTNKEPEDVDQENILKGSNKELIHVDDNEEGEMNDGGNESDESDQMERNDKLGLIKEKLQKEHQDFEEQDLEDENANELFEENLPQDLTV